jgi:hypothetical protein
MWQYNAVGDINFGIVQNLKVLVRELQELKTEFPKAAKYIRERLVELTTTVMVRRFVCPAPFTDDGAKEDRDDAQARGSCHRSPCPRPRASGARAVYPYYPTGDYS